MPLHPIIRIRNKKNETSIYFSLKKDLWEFFLGQQYQLNKVHAYGIKVNGCAILPFQKSFITDCFKQEARDLVNAWIRNSHFYAVIDFDKEMASETDSRTILSNMHDGDFLHPNELGYQRLGDAVDLNLFK